MGPKRPALDDRVGDDAAHDVVGRAGSMAGPNSSAGPVAATFTGTPSWAAACTTGAAAPSVTPGRS